MKESENNWNNFWHTGNISDYLNYKNQVANEELENGTAITDNNGTSSAQSNATEW